MFVVTPPRLHAPEKAPAECVQHDNLWIPCRKTERASQLVSEEEATKSSTEQQMAAPEKQWTTDLDASQRALLEGSAPGEGTAAPASPKNTRSSRPMDSVEMREVLVSATEATVMEEASHVAIVREDRTSFIHRSRVLMKHLVLVRRPCTQLVICDSHCYLS